MQFREYTTTVSINDDQITVTSRIGANQVTDVVVRDGSEDTNFAIAANLHKSIALDAPPVATSPSISVLTLGRWTKFFLGGSFVTLSTIVSVPISNSGVVVLRRDTGGFSLTYNINGGTDTAFADLDEITLADGDVLYFGVTGLAAQEQVTGYVQDKDTGNIIDYISLLNTTP